MERIDQIRKNNDAIYKTINSIIAIYNGEVPKDVMENILTLEQRNIISTYLAMYDSVVLDKDILEGTNLGDVQISNSCASGLNHKTKAVIIGDMSAQIKGLRGSKGYGNNTNAEISAVKDMPTYIKYMLDKGGTELDFYLTTLPHEARHLMGVEGNSGFPEAKGFAEGKNELDTRRAMQYFGFKYYANRNYSMEVSFVEALETIVGKDVVDELGSYKSLEYEKLVKDFGDVFRDFVNLNDQNSIKKDVRLYFETQGKSNVKKDSIEYQERAAIVEAERKKEIEQFKRRPDVGEAKYEEMQAAYAQVATRRKVKLREMLDRIPLELRTDVEKIMNDFDRIHGISDQNEMVEAYDSVSLSSIEDYITSRNLRQEGTSYHIADDKLDTILQVQRDELKQLSKTYEVALGIKGNGIINIEEINVLARNPNVAKEVPIANDYIDELSRKNDSTRDVNDDKEK